MKIIARALTLSLLALLFCTACSTSHNQLTLAQQDFADKNYARAYDKLLILASHGDATAQYAVGYMSYYGMGTAKDENMARIWIRRSADQGNPDAIAALKQLLHDKGYIPKIAEKMGPAASRKPYALARPAAIPSADWGKRNLKVKGQ